MSLQLRDYQREAVDSLYAYFARHDGHPLLVLPTGCHAAGTMILMADGSARRVEDVQVGDRVMGADSTPRTVLRLARGSEPLYTITPKKGEPFVVNESHVLVLRTTNEGKRWPSSTSGQEIETITVRDYIGKSKSWKHLRKLSRTRVDFPDLPSPPLDPWCLGVLLGDGSTMNGAVLICNPDHELLREFDEKMQGLGLRMRWSQKKDNQAYDVAFADPEANCKRPNRVMAILRDLGVAHCGAATKFVPDIYRLGSRETRLQVLAGLVDTDGHVSKTIDFISKSRRLSENVVFIARSLGLWAKLAECEKFCQTGGGGTYWRVCISGDIDIIPTRIERKKAAPRKQKKNPLVTGFSVEPAGHGEFYGFTLDGDHLYVTADFVVHHNSGKSIILSAFIQEVMQQWPTQRVLMVTHVKELIEQNYSKLLALWPSAPVGLYSAGLGRRDTVYPITFAGIQSVHTRAAQFGRIDLVVIDEAHLVPKGTEGMYRTFLEALTAKNPALKVIGLTATPYRLKGGLLHVGSDRLFTDIAYEVDLLRLIDGGYLCPLVPKKTKAEIDTSGVHSRGGEFIARELEAAAEAGNIVARAVDEIVEHGATRRCWLAFCVGKDHARKVQDELRRRGVSTEIVLGDTPAAERARILRAYKAGQIRCLVNVNVLTTGFDAPETDLLAVLRPTQSTGLYVQICLDQETEVLTRGGWRGVGEVMPGDEAAALDMDSGRGVWSTVLDAFSRESTGSEPFVSVQSPRLDIRVTAQHDLIVATRRFDKSFGQWVKRSAIDATKIRDGFRIPAAVQIDGDGVGLTDHDLRFIGLFMTDGTLNKKNNAITIYQSERYQGVIDMIVDTLTGCGFKFSRSIMSGDICFGKPRQCPVHRFTVSKGIPRGRDKHLSGWGRLEAFLSKELAEPLMDCTRAQLDVLLEAIHAGDGAKSDCPGWTRRSYSISTGSKRFAERLQALCVTRGLAANISCSQGGRKNPIFLINISPRPWRSVGGSGQSDRKSLDVEDPTGETVWCVKTAHGTIVTRRNGKVAVVGNCGRGMRVAEGKTDCLVLDFGGNVARHGPIDRVNPKGVGNEDGSAGEPLVKVCPQCDTQVWIGAGRCHQCGYEWPVAENPPHDSTAATDALLSSQQQAKTYEVRAVHYRRHEKPGKPTSLRVDYVVTEGNVPRTISEWVCIEHTGYARYKAEAWWMRRSGGEPCEWVPTTVEDAIALSVGLLRPETITTRPDGKYERITTYGWPEAATDAEHTGADASRAG